MQTQVNYIKLKDSKIVFVHSTCTIFQINTNDDNLDGYWEKTCLAPHDSYIDFL